MKTLVAGIHLALMSVLAFFAMTGEAHAYFDPGTGSMLLQAVAAGLVGAAVFWRRVKDAIHNLMSRKNKKS